MCFFFDGDTGSFQMQVNHDYDANIHRIKSYTKGEIKVVLPIIAQAGDGVSEQARGVHIEILSQSAVVMPGKLIKEWSVEEVAALTQKHIQQLVALEPELVLIGTGEKLVWPSRALMAPLVDANIGYEIMDSAAACRTYNILSHEGRGVAAALMMI